MRLRSPTHLVLSLPLTLALSACADAGGGDPTGETTGGPGTGPGGTTDASGTAGGASTGPSSSGDGTSSTSSDASTTSTTAPPTSATTDEGSTTDAQTDTSSSSGDTTGGVDDLPPTQGDALEEWLALGSYKSWAAESKVHMSTGPHGGNVRTYVNAALFGSLEAGNAMHPQGAATVKELYGGGVDTITGYAVMVKVAPDSAGGEGWYWYERVGGTTYADGTGVGLCSGCHLGGADYVLTPFPLQ